MFFLRLLPEEPSDHQPQIRSFAAVIFRRIASKTRKPEGSEQAMDMFLSLTKDQAAVIRQKVLETLNSEREKPVRNKISDAVAELARQYTETSKTHL